MFVPAAIAGQFFKMFIFRDKLMVVLLFEEL